MKKVLIVVNGFLGDALLSQPIAERLKVEGQADIVDFYIGFPQTKLLLEQNPYIDNVIVAKNPTSTPPLLKNNKEYNEIRSVNSYDGSSSLTIHHQKSAGVKEPTIGYKVYTYPKHDKLVVDQLSALDNRPKIGIGLTWKTVGLRTYNSEKLSSHLMEDYNVLGIGRNPNETHYQSSQELSPEISYSYQASICKHLDLMIGSEGGLTNLASGVGCKVLYTTDFLWTLAGPKGTHYNHPNPTDILGPKAYFPNSDHISLPYNIEPENYIENILKILKNIIK